MTTDFRLTSPPAPQPRPAKPTRRATSPAPVPTEDRIRGLTLWRPWGACIFGWTRRNGIVVPGPKRIENRPWPAPDRMIGQRIAFHDGLTWDHGGAEFMRRAGFDPPTPEEWPAGLITGVARVLDCIDVGAAEAGVVSAHGCFGGDGDGFDEDSDLEELLEDPYCLGPYAWVLDERARLPEPVPCKGAQGLWTLPPDVEARVREQVETASPPKPEPPRAQIIDLGEALKRSCER